MILNITDLDRMTEFDRERELRRQWVLQVEAAPNLAVLHGDLLSTRLDIQRDALAKLEDFLRPLRTLVQIRDGVKA